MPKPNSIKAFLQQPISIAPLVFLRVLFGGVMLASIIRFVANGWIESQYIQPDFFFKYYGFEWVTAPGEWGIYALFAFMGGSAIFIMLGFLYRYAALAFFLAFTYVELIDVSNYLNHYYFISIMALLLVFVPANRNFSLDVLINPKSKRSHIPRWIILIFQVQLGIVYFYAGLAKLNYDWLINAEPMRIWLPAKSDMFLIGPLFKELWVAYFFSWAGAIYDLSIVFFLSFSRTRPFAYLSVLFFHLMTAALFQIGMFPYIMILLTLIFFPPAFHERILARVKAIFKINTEEFIQPRLWQISTLKLNILGVLLIGHFAFQLLFPFRFALYPGNLFWTEEGYRFSWRVMLMEKAGTCFFYVTNPETGKSTEVEPNEYLSKNQEKMMATQPDMILQFAHYLKDIYREKGIENPEVRVKSYVRLNGNGSRLFIDPEVNLATIQDGFRHKNWILPFTNPQNFTAQKQ
ncbi:MAG: HTTM domain-containing protein [Chitinophagales bacterium]